MLLVLILLAFEPRLAVAVLNTSLINELITSARVLDSVLPLEVELVALLMQSFEFFRGFVKLNLRRLRLGNFLLKLLRFPSNLNG